MVICKSKLFVFILIFIGVFSCNASENSIESVQIECLTEEFEIIIMKANYSLGYKIEDSSNENIKNIIKAQKSVLGDRIHSLIKVFFIEIVAELSLSEVIEIVDVNKIDNFFIDKIIENLNDAGILDEVSLIGLEINYERF